MPPSSSWITQACRQAPAASAVVSDPLDESSIPRTLMTPPLLLLSRRDRLPLSTPPSSSSIPWARKHTAASAVGDVLSGVSFLLLPLPTPPLSSSSPRDHLSLSMILLLLPIPQARHRSDAPSVVIPKSSPPSFLSPIAQMCCLSLVL